MEEVIRTLAVAFGPVVIFWTAIGIVYSPELFVRMPFRVKAALIGIGAVLVTIALYLNGLGSINHGLVMVGFILLVAPIAAQLVSHFALARVQLRCNPNNTDFHQSCDPPMPGFGG